ncbi:MAG: hypothetical protein HYS08_06365 [Chlamydiae bacterium]|nr:hypothetical protein [Chlamydiota bacterium]
MEKSLGDHERKNPRDLDKREEEEKTVEEFLKESLWECARCGTPFHFEEDLKTHEFHCKKSQNTSQHGQHHYRNNAKGWAQPIVS